MPRIQNRTSFQPDELAELRTNFPHIDGSHIYLNHASIAPISLLVKEAIEAFIYERHRGAIENLAQSMERGDETRKLVAEYIHAESPSQITFTGNTSDGISAVAEGLDWNRGDQVILNTMEFPSNVQPFRILEKQGVELIFLEPEEGVVTADMIRSAVTPKTRMVSISAVQFLNGFRADLEAIGMVCREKNLFFAVDAIQALGACRIDVQKCNIDVLATGGHKWLMSVMGFGFLFLSEKMSLSMRPYKTGWLSVEEPWDLFRYDQNWLPLSGHLETGTPNMIGITALGTSIKNFLKIGPGRIESHISSLSDYIIQRITEADSARLITPASELQRAGIVSFSLPGERNPADIVEQLKKEKISISAREGYFRIAPHYYNTMDEIDQVLELIL